MNDRFGHLVGDHVLQSVAALLHDGLRHSDIAVRWGGEEFLLLLRGCDQAEAERIADSLRKKVEQARFSHEGAYIPVTLSVGVSEYHGQEALEQTIRRADVALYEAKRSGRNRVSASRSPAAPPG